MIVPAVCASICLPSSWKEAAFDAPCSMLDGRCAQSVLRRVDSCQNCGAGAVSQIDRRTTSCHWIFRELSSRFSQVCAVRIGSFRSAASQPNAQAKAIKKSKREFAHPLFTITNSTNLGRCWCWCWCCFWGCRTFVDDGPEANSPERRVLHICYSDSVCSYASVERKVSTRALPAFFYGSFFPPGFTGGFRVESSRAGHMAIDGRIGNAQLYKYFINAKIPSVVHVP